MTLDKKHIIILAIAAIALLFVGMAWLRAHDAWKDMQADLRVHSKEEKAADTTVQKNQAMVADGDKSIAQANKNIGQIDADTRRKLDGLQAQLDSKPDAAQIRTIVQQALPGVKTVEAKDAAGNSLIAVADTQENRDLINAKDVAFKSCQFNLDDCQQKQKQFQAIIDTQGQQISALQGSVTALKTSNDTLTGDLKRAQQFGKGGNIWARTGRVAIPAGCGAAGAGLAAQGGLKPKGVLLASGISALTCAFTFRF